MRLHFTFLALLLFAGSPAVAQWQWQWAQNFEVTNGPSNYNYPLKIQIDTSRPGNIWQVGAPQKTLFNRASTIPNVIITDTVNTYPPNDTSSFQYATDSPSVPRHGIGAYRWKQKLDMDSNGGDGAKVEYSIDSGRTWTNAFGSPYTYNFYGFQSRNIDTLAGGEIVFSGTDTVWRDIWLCFDQSWLSTPDSNGRPKRLIIRHTFMSDSVDQHREGWMMDNFMVHRTLVHTVARMKAEAYLRIYPNPTADILHIEAQKIDGFHIIEHLALTNALGQVAGQWHDLPTHFFIATHSYPDGLYYLHIKTNLREETLPVMIRHN